MKDIFLKLMFSILKNYMIFKMTYHFYPKEWKKLLISMIKMNMLFI